jgi:hypothetical protein
MKWLKAVSFLAAGLQKLPPAPKQFLRAAKSFLLPREAILKRTPLKPRRLRQTGCDHVGIYSQSGLRPVLQEISRRNGATPASVDMTDGVAG